MSGYSYQAIYSANLVLLMLIAPRVLALLALILLINAATFVHSPAVRAQTATWPDAKPAFPLIAQPGNGGFVDQNGVPFLIVGDASWALLVRLNDTELAQFLADRRARGFNTLIARGLEGSTVGGPTNTNGDDPFSPINDITQPVEAYWARVDSILNAAQQEGFLVLMSPLYVGFGCGDQGWGPQMQSISVADHESYADFLAARYGNQPNLVWVHGGDADAAQCGLGSKVSAVAYRLKASSPAIPNTAHCNRQNSSLDCYNESWLDLNAVYSDCQQVARKVRDNYLASPALAHFFIEGTYENEGASSACLMSQMYMPFLGGLKGSIYGNFPLWPFDPKWQNALADPGATFVEWSARLMKSRAWADLVPDYSHVIVTSGFGSIDSASYVAAAATTNRQTMIAYVADVANFTVDLTQMSGSSVKAWIFDPKTGASTSAGTFPTTGSQVFQLTGPQVLVVDDEAAGFAAPGTEIFYVPEPAGTVLGPASLAVAFCVAHVRRATCSPGAR